MKKPEKRIPYTFETREKFIAFKYTRCCTRLDVDKSFNEAYNVWEKYHEQEIKYFKQTLKDLEIEIDYLVIKSRNLPTEKEILNLLLEASKKFNIDIESKAGRSLPTYLAKKIFSRQQGIK